MSLLELQQVFGNSAAYYYDISRGIDHREVVSKRIRKSLGSETTFESDIDDVDEMLSHLGLLAIEVSQSLIKKEVAGHTLTLKVKYDNFEQITRSKTVTNTLCEVEDMLPIIAELLTKTAVEERKVRLLGISLSNFDNGEDKDLWMMRQQDLFKKSTTSIH